MLVPGASLGVAVWSFLSNGHDFLLLMSQMRINLADVIVRQLLQLLLGMFRFILGGAAIVAVFFELFHRVAPDMPDGHAAIFSHLADDFDKLLTPFLAQFG